MTQDTILLRENQRWLFTTLPGIAVSIASTTMAPVLLLILALVLLLYSLHVAANVHNFEAPLLYRRNVKGNIFSSGHYFMSLSIGIPAQTVLGLLDTASDLTELSCQPDLLCPAYGVDLCTSRSITFKRLSCSSEACVHGERPFGADCRSGSQSGTCRYNLSSFAGEFLSGELSSETLTLQAFDERGPSLISMENFLLGCTLHRSGKCQAMGVVALGRGPFSFSSQLASLFQRRFAYYLRQITPSSYGEVQAAGSIYFGPCADDYHSSKALYTPLLMGAAKQAGLQAANTLYSVSFSGFSVANKRIDLRRQTSAVINTGIPPMLVPLVTFLDVAEAVSGAVPFPYFTNADVGGGPPNSCEALCYTVNRTDRDLRLFPDFIFHFENMELHIPLTNAYVQWNSSTICLAMLGCRLETSIVLGHHVQQSFRVIFDLEEQQVGFVPPTFNNH